MKAMGFVRLIGAKLGFREILQALALSTLLCLLARPAAAQCNPQVASVTISPSSIIAISTDPTGLAHGTVTLTCIPSYNVAVSLSNTPDKALSTGGTMWVNAGNPSGTFNVKSWQISETTEFTVTATVGSSSAQASITVVPLTPTMSASPGTIQGGVGQGSNFSVTLNAPANPYPFASVGFGASDNSNGVLYGQGGPAFFFGEKGPKTFTKWANGVATTQNYTVTVRDAFGEGGPPGSAAISVTPSIYSQMNMGICVRCLEQAGHPINVTSGNTYIQQRDYSLPGLGGGLESVRIWNSLWHNFGPTSITEMFGEGWRSTYEETFLFPDANTVNYWRNDGSLWVFTYNSAMHTYLLSTPPDAHVSLVKDPVTNQFTLTFPDGTQKIMTQGGNLKTIIDRNGNQVSLTYDSSNRLIKATDAAGRILNFNYSNPTYAYRVSSIQDSVGVVAQYTYDSNRNLTQVLYADGSSLNFTYGSAFGLLTVKDAQGKLLESHTYDAGRGLTSTRAYGVDQVSLSYTALGQTELTDSMGNTTTYGYDVVNLRNFVTSVSGPGCSSCGGRGNNALTYDAYGNQTSSTDALGRTTTYTYDVNGNVLTRSIQLDASTTLTWTYTYNGFQEILTAADPLGNVTTNTYDSAGNLLTTTTPPPSGTGSGLTTSFAYDVKGQLTQVTDPNGNATTIAYTTAGLIASVTDAQSNATTFAYDARGNRTSSTDALGNTTTFAYDATNRLTAITQPGNITTTFGYDTRGRRTSVTDANSKTTSYQYDDADRLLAVTDAAAHVTSYQYDTENHLASITDALGRVTNFSYDSLGRVTGVTFPSTLTESYNYDAVGNLTSKTDRKGQTISYAYDNLDRLTSKSYPDSTAVSYAYDALSRLIEASDPTGTYSFSYDHVGRLTGTTTNYSFLSRTLTTSYTYDAASNRDSMTDPEGGVTSYTYDTLNRLTGLTDFNFNSFGLSYDQLGRRTSLTRPNGVSTNYQYDNLSRLLSVLHQVGANTLDGAAYTVDSAGNRLSKSDALSATTSNYTYDAIYQLTQVVASGTPPTTSETYSFDAVGNRLSSLGVSPYSYNSSNELTSTPNATFTYDGNGNTTSKVDAGGTTNYTWDFENRLTSVTLPGSGGSVNFKYDPFGRRVYKSSSTSTSIYAYDGDNIIEEMDSSGSAVARYTQGLGIDEPLAILRSSTTSYYEADGLGSITSLSNDAGSLTQTYTYDSFGQQTASSGSLINPFLYTGREFDSETGLYYYRARYYDPSAGRFLSEDALRFSSDPDFYLYVANRPTRFRDPSGRQSCCETHYRATWGIWGAIGGGTYVALNSIVVDAATGGINILLSPGEVAAGALLGGSVGYTGGAIVDLANHIICRSRSNPFTGQPGEISTTARPDGSPKQVRRYGPDGYPETDVDYDHDHSQGKPHSHDWGRPADGSPPNADDRGPGRPVKPSDPQPE
jgi:RHS repeat-associated protein